MGADNVLLTLFFLVILMEAYTIRQSVLIKNYVELLFLFCIIFLPLRISHEFFNPPNNYPTPIFSWLCTTPIYWFFLILTILIYFLINSKNTRQYIYSFWKLFFKYSGKTIVILLSLYIVILGCSLIPLNIIESLPLPSFFRFSDSWGNGRGLTVKIGMTIFNNQTFFHKLFGIGPDSMSFYLYDQNNIFLYSDLLQAFDNQILTNAHCDYITVLINTGILGLISLFFLVHVQQKPLILLALLNGQ